jgi:hypothetical protein
MVFNLGGSVFEKFSEGFMPSENLNLKVFLNDIISQNNSMEQAFEWLDNNEENEDEEWKRSLEDDYIPMNRG